jgi:hypothetical protein
MTRAGIAVISGHLLCRLLHLPPAAEIVAMWPNDDGDLCLRIHHESLPECVEGRALPRMQIISERIESRLEIIDD